MRLLIYKLVLISIFFIGISFAAFGQCETDTSLPSAICNDQIDIGLDENGIVIITPAIINAGSSDGCTSNENLIYRLETGETSNGTIPTTTSLQFDTPGSYIVFLWVIDEAGNINKCWSTINVTGNPSQCIEDTEAPTLECLKNLYAIGSPLLLFGQDFIQTVFDNCSKTESITYSIQLAEDFTGRPSTNQFIEVTESGIYKVYVWATDEQGNSDFCKSELVVKETITVIGNVYQDDDQNCIRSTNENGINQSIRITLFEDNVATYTIVVLSENGDYQTKIPKPTATDARIEAALEISDFPTCSGSVTANILANSEEVILADIGLQLQQGCADLGVTIEALSEGCSQDGIYIIKFYNSGTEMTNPIIRVDFSNQVEFNRIFSTHSYEYTIDATSPNIYNFGIQNLQPGAYGDIVILGRQICDFDNQTQVITAMISAENACSNKYTGAEINIVKDCVGEEVQFRIQNVGQEDMLAPANFIVIEDVIMRQQGTFQLGVGESEAINLSATGATVHLRAEQVATYPWQSTITAVSEGCAIDQSSIKTGLVAQLPLENSTPFIDVDVIENKSTLFNRIIALPVGIGEKHEVSANTPIEYAIHYANKSKNEVTKNLVIATKISENLDLSTLKVTFTSHPAYVLTKKEDNIVEFAFPNISLLSSDISTDEGTGLIKFTVEQKANLPNNTLIENTVKLTFDNNMPLNNSIFHTVGENVISTSTTDILLNGIELTVYPNPFKESTHFKVENPNLEVLQFELYTANGQLMQQRQFATQTFTLHRNDLKNGFYFYVIKRAGQPVGVGKLFIE